VWWKLRWQNRWHNLDPRSVSLRSVDPEGRNKAKVDEGSVMETQKEARSSQSRVDKSHGLIQGHAVSWVHGSKGGYDGEKGKGM